MIKKNKKKDKSNETQQIKFEVEYNLCIIKYIQLLNKQTNEYIIYTLI